MRRFNWLEFQKRVTPKHYWRRWNLEYTKRVLAGSPHSAMARGLLDCWPLKIKMALRKRFALA